MIHFNKWLPCAFIILTCISVNSTSERRDKKVDTTAIISKKIYVDQSGHGDFDKIQLAIDSIPPNNKEWIVIDIKAGLYREKVIIPQDKPFVILKGEGRINTRIVWNETDDIHKASFISLADNFLAKGISFENSYNYPRSERETERAVAAMLRGDKSAFYGCAFSSMQDTLFDESGRHYFSRCSIRGSVDFIFGDGQSFYENCAITVLGPGAITAQGREDPKKDSGYVFKNCTVQGKDETILGRAYRPYSRVLFYNSSLSDIVRPEGWDSWNKPVNLISFSEFNNSGPGADILHRVPWMKKLDPATLGRLINRTSFIDTEGWISQQPRV